MGGSESKASPTGIDYSVGIGNLPEHGQRDHLLDLLNEGRTRKDAEYKEIEDKLNKKLQNVLALKKNQKDASEMLNLKQEKLEFKLKKLKEQYELEKKMVCMIRQLYLDKRTEVRLLKNSKVPEVDRLNNQIEILKERKNNLKRELEDLEEFFKDLELREVKEAEDKLQLTNLTAELADVQKDVSNLQMQMREMRKTKPV